MSIDVSSKYLLTTGPDIRVCSGGRARKTSWGRNNALVSGLGHPDGLAWVTKDHLPVEHLGRQADEVLQQLFEFTRCTKETYGNGSMGK